MIARPIQTGLRHCAAAALAVFTLSAPILAVAAPLADTIEVQILGAVLQPGVYNFERGARLNDAAVAGQVSSEAWYLGAALLREDAIEAQTRLKAGILFELRTNGVHAQAQNDGELRALLLRLHTVIEAMPVTGRVQAEMAPLKQLFLVNNKLLEDGDSLIYPYRPNQVRVTGAVVKDCELEHDPAMKLHDYRDACQQLSLADLNVTYLIQPDGNVSQHGAAYWNLEEADVAVGAVVYVPLKTNELSPTTVALNDDIAAMLGTQYQLGGRFEE